MKRTWKAVLCLILGAALVMSFGAASFAQESVPADAAGEITVSASGAVLLTPDKATVSFGVTTQEETAELAQSKNSEAVQKVIDVLTERGVEEKSIRTTYYNMYPQYDYSEAGGQRIVGYSVSTSMSVQDQNLENVGKLLADCVAAGVNNIDNISFLCSGYDEAYQEALTEAVGNARVKAETLAKAAGKTLGEAVSITEGWEDTSARYGRAGNYYMEMAMDSMAKGPALMPGESEISANVTVTYQMKG